MLMLKFIRDRQLNCQIIPRLGNSLGDGADGECFELLDDPEKVIKISILCCYFGQDLNSEYFRIQTSLSYLLSNNDPLYTRVYAHATVGKFSRTIFNDRVSLGEEQDYFLFHYTMGKCQKLSEDERKVFHTIVDHEDRNIAKNYNLGDVKKTLSGLSKGLDFDINKVMLFYNNLRKSPLRHRDISVRNIMKDNDGYFKLIDLDRTELEQ